MKTPLVIVLLILLLTGATLLLLGERAGTPIYGGVDMAREVEAIMQADRDFDRATAERGAEGWASFFAEDGKMFRDGGRIIQGHQTIRDLMEPFLSNPNNSLRWAPVHATVAVSGDLGYSYGNWVLKGLDRDGNAVKQYGKYVSIWKKVADGSWKVAIDLGTNGSDTPPDDYRE